MMPSKFLILCRSPNPATRSLQRNLHSFGSAVVVSDQPTDDDSVWIPDDRMAGFEGLATWAADGPAVTAWERALKHLAEAPGDESGVWFIEDDVAGSVESFRKVISHVHGASPDFAAFEVKARNEDHGWPHWHGRGDTFSRPTRSFNPFCFVSSRLLQRVFRYQELHQRFMFHEVLFASLARCSGGLCLDFADDPATWLLFRNFRFRPEVIEPLPEGICHPVKDYFAHEAICAIAPTSPAQVIREHPSPA